MKAASIGRWMRAILALVFSGLAPAQAQQSPAQLPDGYPKAKPIRFIVTVAPGGGLDLMARDIAKNLTERWGVAALVENRQGASGGIGMDFVAKSPPDGYTILVFTPDSVATAAPLKIVSFDPQTVFVPVVQMNSQPYVLTVHPSLPVNSVKSLIALAKARPGSLAYGSSGIGGTSHLSAEVFKSMAGVDMVHVPYKGVALAAVDLIGGNIQVLLGNTTTVGPHIKSGRLKALAVTGLQRSTAYPALPTVAETVPGYEAGNSHWLFVPAATPPAIINALNQGVNAIMQSSTEIRARLSGDGSEIVPPNSPGEAKAKFAKEAAFWAKFLKEHPGLIAQQ